MIYARWRFEDVIYAEYEVNKLIVVKLQSLQSVPTELLRLLKRNKRSVGTNYAY